MYIMVIILKDESLLKKLLSLMIEFELYDATVLDGESIENIASKKIPLFSDLNTLFGQQTSYNRTILSYIPDGSTTENFIQLCKEEAIDFRQPDVGCIMTIPCNMYIGES